MIPSCQCQRQLYICNPVIFVSFRPQYFSSYQTIYAASVWARYVASEDERSKDIWEIFCKLENTGHLHHKVNEHSSKKELLFHLKVQLMCLWKYQIKSGKKQCFSFFLPVSFAAMKNIHVAILMILLGKNHSLMYKITDKNNRHVCLCPYNLNSMMFKQHIAH